MSLAPGPDPVKTDPRDAERIAQLLRTGWFQPVRCKSVWSQERRALLGTRNALVGGITRLELLVRGILRNLGLVSIARHASSRGPAPCIERGVRASDAGEDGDHVRLRPRFPPICHISNSSE